MPTHARKTSPADIVRLGIELQLRGYQVGEHPEFGGVHPTAHIKGSKHYADPCEAIDVNDDRAGYTSRWEDDRLDHLAQELVRAKFGAIWNRGPGDHTTHAHFETWGNPVQYAGRVRAKRARSWPRLVVDGALGPKTIRALQLALQTPADGVISQGGSTVVRAMQALLNTEARRNTLKIDGVWGPKTTRALQRYLGTPVTGGLSSYGSTCIKALQRQLNAYGALR